MLLDTLLVVAILENIGLDAKGRKVTQYLNEQEAEERYKQAAATYIGYWILRHRQVFQGKSSSGSKLSVVRTVQRLSTSQIVEAVNAPRSLGSMLVRSLEKYKLEQRRWELETKVSSDPVLERLNALGTGILKLWRKINGTSEDVANATLTESFEFTEINLIAKDETTVPNTNIAQLQHQVNTLAASQHTLLLQNKQLEVKLDQILHALQKAT